jgi:hypothetical protein
VVPSSILNAVISRRLVDSSCARMLSGDGTTTPDLTVKGAQRVFGAVLVNVRVARKSVSAVGEAASAAKNLDEYQFMIYSLVPSIPDSTCPRCSHKNTVLPSLLRLPSSCPCCRKCSRMAYC